jgi:ATP-dependent Zn protease
MILHSKAVTDSEGFLFINKDENDLKSSLKQTNDEKIWKIKNHKFVYTLKDEENKQILKLLNFILKTIKTTKYRKLFPLRLILIEKNDELKNDSQEIINQTNDKKSSVFSSILSFIFLFIKLYIFLFIFALIFILVAESFGLANLSNFNN